MADKKIRFIDHINELRNRLLIYFLSLIVFSLAAYPFAGIILELLKSPTDLTLYYLSPTEAIEAYINLSLMTGFILSIPILLYNLFKFIKPTLSKNFKFNFVFLSFFSLLLALLGGSFAMYVLLPITLNFLLSFSESNSNFIFSTNNYLNFVTKYIIAFALVFQIPVLIYLINIIKKIHPKSLLNTQKYIIAISIVIAAIITPTVDPINQLIVAAPILVMYYLSILTLYLSKFTLVLKGK